MSRYNPIAYFVFALIAIAVILYFLLPRARKDVEVDPETGEQRTIIRYVGGGLGRDRLLWDELKRAFERTHPHIILKFVRSFSPRKVETMIAGGVAPDIISVGSDQVAYYLEAKALTDLTDFIRQDPQFYADLQPGGDFYDIMIEPFRVEERIYMIPIWYTPFVVFYNKDLFDKYNVPYPNENWSWADLRDMALRLTHDTNGDGKIDEFGLYFAQWQHGIETFILQNGGRILSEDGTRVEMTHPKTVEALQFLYDLKFKDQVCPSSFLSPGVSPARMFMQGKVGMFGPWGVFRIVDFRTQIRGFDWDVAPLPMGPEGRRAGIVAPTAFGVSSQSKHKKEAYQFVRFLASREGMRIIAKWALFIPCRKSVARSPAFLDPRTKPDNDWALLHDVENGYAHLPAYTSTRYYDVYKIVNEELERLLELNVQTPEETARRITEQANRILERVQPVLAPSRGIIWPLRIPLLIVALGLVTWMVMRFRRNKPKMGKLGRVEERWGFILISPWIVGFLALSLGPILFSFGLSFCRWQSLASLSTAKLVGIENYHIALGGDDPKFWKSLWVTFRYTMLAVPLGVGFGLLLALLMNAKLKGIHFFRTLYFSPAVLPAVAVTVLWWYIFNADSGWINWLLSLLGIRGPAWLNDPQVVLYVFVLMSLWGVGGGMIIFLAGLQGIPSELYEAAEIDGASRWHRFLYVTLPMISPIIFFNLVMGIIGSFQVFTQAFVMYGGEGGPDDAALFYVLHLFIEAFEKYRFGYGSALAWILFVIILTFTILIFKSSPLWVYYEGKREER